MEKEINLKDESSFFAGQERGQSEALTIMRSSRVPSRGMSEAKGEQESTETLSFRCDCERCRFMRGRIHFSLT